jgi:PAS domain S-box-containing protein
MGTPPDPALDDLARLAAHALHAPVATLELIGATAIWTRAAFGAPHGASPRQGGMWDRLLAARGAVVARDAAGPGPTPDSFGFCAAAPLRTRDGHAIGVLRVFDRAPRDRVDPAALDALERLAAVAVALIDGADGNAAEARRAAASARRARLMAAAAGAATTADIVALALRELRDATGARGAAVTRVNPDGRRVVALGADVDDPALAAALIKHLRARDQTIDFSMTGRALAAGRPIVVELADMPDPAARLANAVGVTAIAFVPMELGEDRYVFSAGVARERAELDRVVVAAAEVVSMLGPLFLRLRGIEEADLLRRVIDASGEGVMIAEAATEARPTPEIIYANPRLLEMTGYAAADLIGQSPYILKVEDEAGALEAGITQTVIRGETWASEMRNRRADGSTFWAAVSVSPVPDAAGAITHSVSIRRDITAEKAEAERVAQSEAAFRSLFEKNPIPMWIFDRETLRFVEVNDAAVHSYGYSRERFLSMTMLDIRPPEDVALARAVMRDRGEGPREIGPFRHLDARGRLREVLIMSNRFTHRGRDSVMVAVWDVTERQRAERALRDAQRLARIGAWRWRPGEDAPLWSVEAVDLIGRDAAIEAADVDTLRAALDEAAGASGPVEFDFRARREDGSTRHFHALGRRARDEMGRPVVDGYIQDVTEAREAVEGLRRAERLSAIGQLTGGVAHDFNNLLTIALGNVEMARERARDPEAAEMLAQARSAIERGARLTSQLLAFARRQPLAAADVALAPFLSNLLQLVGRTIGETHAATAKVDPEAAAARCDPTQLEAAVLNLILNARDATPGGGAIAIRARRAGADEIAAAGLDPAAAMIALSVADNGPGVPCALRARILEPFFTTKPPGKGAGMGLSMALGFARQSGGELTLGDAPEGGLLATLLLPAAVARAAAPGADRAAEPLGDALDVLAVEDDEAVRAATAAMLKSLGVSAVCVPTAAEALAMLAAGFHFDLLFSDVVLGGPMDGLALAREARRLQPDLAVLLTTGYAEALIETADAPDQPTILPKPYAPSTLRAAIAGALARRRAQPA